MKYKLTTTWSRYGELEIIDLPVVVIENSEFVGTPDEFHSGTQTLFFDTYLKALEYLIPNQLEFEYFDIVDTETQSKLFDESDLHELQSNIHNEEAFNMVSVSNEPIGTSEGYYSIYGDVYSESCDIDSVIREVTQGEYESMEDAYGDECYWTTNGNEDEVLQSILEQGYYYNINAEKIQL